MRSEFLNDVARRMQRDIDDELTKGLFTGTAAFNTQYEESVLTVENLQAAMKWFKENPAPDPWPIRYHVVNDIKSQRRRSWRKRLFSLPWRPWKALEVHMYNPIEDGRIFRYQGNCFVNPRTFRHIKDTLESA